MMDRLMEIGDDPNEKLGAMSYEWTVMLLMDDKIRAPTRYELFQARKEYEEIIKMRRLLLTQMRQAAKEKKQAEKMLKAIKNCVRRLGELKKEAKQERIENLLKSKRATRCMIAKFKNSKIELKAISKEARYKMRLCNELLQLEYFGVACTVFVQGVEKLDDRITAYKELTDELLQSLER